MTNPPLKQPLVSVLIPTYNGSAFIRETLDSVLAQTYTNFEVLVVDDESKDETAQIVRQIAEQDSRIRYIHQKNAGTASARNRGLREAKGEFIALLDHDDLWMPERLALEVPLLADPEVGLVHAGIEWFLRENGTERITSVYFPGENVGLTELLGRTVLGVQTMLFRRSILEQLNGFDTQMRGCDDWDICIRVAEVSRIVGVPQILGRVRLHDAQQGGNAPMMFENNMKLVAKHSHYKAKNKAYKRALQTAEFEIRENYYEYIKDDIRRALKSPLKINAIYHLGRAIVVHPGGLKRILRRKLRLKN